MRPTEVSELYFKKLKMRFELSDEDYDEIILHGLQYSHSVTE